MFDLLVGGLTVAYLAAAHFVPLTVVVYGVRVQAAIRLTWLVVFHYFLGTARTRTVLPQYPTRKRESRNLHNDVPADPSQSC